MIKDILEKHKAYTLDLELDLLRYVERLRNEILEEKKCNCDDNKHGELNSGWYCPVHGQCF